MGYRFKSWGLDGSLSSFRDFATFLGNGYNTLPTGSATPEIVGDRCDLVVEDGYNALRIKHYLGDGEVYGHRTELVADEFSHIADWVGEAVPGADANHAVRQYRVCFKLPEQDFANFSSGVNFLLVMQIHQVPDDDPADEYSLNPAIAIHLKPDVFGRWRLCVLRQNDANATPVSSKALEEIVSWPYRPGEWEDIHVAVTWSYSSSGLLTIYRNRRPVIVADGVSNCPNNSPARGGGGLYPKIGVYHYPDGTFYCLHRGLIVGDHETTFADMYPELNGAVPLERVSGPGGQFNVS